MKEYNKSNAYKIKKYIYLMIKKRKELGCNAWI